MKLTKKRFVQLFNLSESLLARSDVCRRGAAHLDALGNSLGASRQRRRAAKYHKAATRAESLLERYV